MIFARVRTASISLSTTANGSSSGAMKIRPITLMTATGTPLRLAPIHVPRPGTPAGKFAGRSRRGWRGMYSRTSFLSQM